MNIISLFYGAGGLDLGFEKAGFDTVDWVLKDINTSINFYAQGEVTLSPRGSLKIGRITMQRKGGTPDPTSLQFKINPLELFHA